VKEGRTLLYTGRGHFFPFVLARFIHEGQRRPPSQTFFEAEK
jgi:hypothetical protein